MASSRLFGAAGTSDEEGGGAFPHSGSEAAEMEGLVSPSSGKGRRDRSPWLRVALVAIAALVLACMYLSLQLSSVRETASRPFTQADEIERMMQQGVDVGQPLPSQYNVSTAAVAQLRQLVEAGGLVSGYNNTLMVGLTNYGFRDFAYNWLCFTRRLGLTNFLLACVDVESCDELRLLGYGKHVVQLDELFPESGASQCGGNKTHNFRSPCFNLQTRLKAQLVLVSLLAGYNTVLTDLDISLLHNPFLYMPLQYDWEIQLEPNELCTGWYYNAASPAAIRMQAEVLHSLEQHANYDDQVAYNVWVAYRIFLHSDDKVRQHVFPLNRVLFPIGKNFGDMRAVLWHNNWLKSADEKRAKMRLHNVYLYQQAETAAAASKYIAKLPAGETTVGADGTKSPVWRAVDGGAVATPPSEPLLVCAVCAPCVNLTPAAQPLRETFPGPLLSVDLAKYGAPWPKQLTTRLLPGGKKR